MKNFKSLLLAVAVAAGALFTSCTEDTASTVTVKLDAVTFSDTVEVKGSITAAAGLESVMLLKDDATLRTIKTFTTGEITTKSDGVYTVALDKLVAGSYKLRATDKNANEHTFAFTVTTTAPAVVTPVLTPLTNNITIFTTSSDGITLSTCASATGTTYAAKNLGSTDQAKIDFIYFNGNGTTVAAGPHTTIYAPNATPTALDAALTGWSTKNATKFSKQTSNIYSTTDYAAVKLIADAASATSASDLATGDEVVFKTASGKVGIFKVVSVLATSAYANTENIVISVKVQN